MSASTDTPSNDSHLDLDLLGEKPVPGLLLVAAPGEVQGEDRSLITAAGVVLGRGPGADWVIDDRHLSKRHARFFLDRGRPQLQDLGAKNGIHIGGQRLRAGTHRALRPGDVIRCGRCLLTLCADLRPLFGCRSVMEARGTTAKHGLVGRFYSPSIIADIARVASMDRHLLLVGESGTGKELAARAISALRASRRQTDEVFVAHNCARITGQDEATSTIFGVAAGTFSSVSARPGLIERAEGGVLLLDEIHVLPIRVQRALLRFVEDGVFSRIGETRARHVDLCLICCTNIDLRHIEAEKQLAQDLLNRLHRVDIPPLSDRIADVPEIFCHFLRRSAGRLGLSRHLLLDAIRPAHLEALCLISYEQRNVRELIDLADTFASIIAAQTTGSREDPAHTLSQLLADTFPDNPVVVRSRTGRAGPFRGHRPGLSHYEKHRSVIIATYRESNQNISETVRRLKQQGLPLSRRWLRIYLDRWGKG